MNIFLNALVKGVSSASPKGVSRWHAIDPRVHFPVPSAFSFIAFQGSSDISTSFSEARDRSDIVHTDQLLGAQKGLRRADRGS